MDKLRFEQLSESLENYDLLLFDLWGVIVEGDMNYPGVVDAINQMMEKTDVMFLTNAPRPSFISEQILRSWGLSQASADRIITSGDIARQMIAQHNEKIGKISKVYHLGEDRNTDILTSFDYQKAESLEDADILLLSIYRDEHENIHEFDEFLQKAAKMPNLLVLCSNPDTIIPKQGTLRYCAGYFAEIIETFGGKVIYTGKPKNIIYDYALAKRPGIAKNRVLMIGDTFETDIQGAQDAGIHSALVMTGNAARFHEMHESREDKLSALYKRAQKVGAMPTFVTSIV